MLTAALSMGPPSSAIRRIGALARTSVWRAVLVNEPPRARRLHRREIVVGIASLVTRRPIADFEVHDVFRCLVDEVVRVTRARLEACAHPWLELHRAAIGAQRGATLQDVDELVLPGMRVSQGRDRTGHQAGQVDTEIRKAEQVA